MPKEWNKIKSQNEVETRQISSRKLSEMKVKFQRKFVCCKAYQLNLLYKLGSLFLYQFNNYFYNDMILIVNQITYNR